MVVIIMVADPTKKTGSRMIKALCSLFFRSEIAFIFLIHVITDKAARIQLRRDLFIKIGVDRV
jgi:hypothetical protein